MKTLKVPVETYTCTCPEKVDWNDIAYNDISVLVAYLDYLLQNWSRYKHGM